MLINIEKVGTLTEKIIRKSTLNPKMETMNEIYSCLACNNFFTEVPTEIGSFYRRWELHFGESSSFRLLTNDCINRIETL